MAFNRIFELIYRQIFNGNKTNRTCTTQTLYAKFIEDIQMIKCKIYLILFLLFFSFYSLSASAQDSVSLSKPAFDSIHTNESKQHYLKAPALIIPATFIIYGGLRPVINDIAKLDNRVMAHFEERNPGRPYNAADYLMWVPSAAIYTMDAFKVKTPHNFKQHLLLDAGSIAVTGALGFGMRIISRHLKGFDTDNTEFPSGHTANAFRGAEILHQELKQKSPLLSYSGYVIATTVGVLRIAGKEHYLSQVVAGAGLGILSTKITYWIFDKIRDIKHPGNNVSF